MAVYLDWTFLCPGCGGGAVARYRPTVEGRRVVRYEPRTAVCVSEGCEIERRLIPLDPIAIGTPSPLQG